MKKQRIRYFAFFMVLNLLFEVVSPTLSMALTSGTIQPEFTGFEPAGSSEMVDLFSGDFKYNIPLMDVDGYPLNLAYHAGTGMENEASWVGLGWSMNPGVLNRAIKGLPDDFNGDVVSSETHLKPHVAMGVGYQESAWFGFNVSFQIPGTGGELGIGAGPQVGVDASLVLTYNNYKGYGIEAQFDGNASLSANIGPLSGSVGGGVGMTLSSQDGATLSYQHSTSYRAELYSATVGEGTSINTRTGSMTKTYFGNQSVSLGKMLSIGLSTSHTLPSGSVAYSPRISNDFTGSGFGLSVKLGLWGCVDIPIPPITLSLKGGTLVGFKGFYNKMELLSKTKTSLAYGYMNLENANDWSLMDFNRFRDGAISEEVPNAPLANLTYDNYSATAQGMGSNFRPFRSDVGTVHDPVNTNNNINSPTSTELSALVLLHLLIDVMNITSNGTSGNWNTLISNIKFKDKDVTQTQDRYYEKAYFKQFGELTARNSTFDNSLGNENAIAPSLIKIADGYDAASTGGLSGNTRTRRDIRSTNINYLTAKQADEYGYEKTMNFYDVNPVNHTVNSLTHMVDKSVSNVSRKLKAVPGNSSYAVDSHLSEISLTNTNGSRYVYGVPAYNLYKKRVMFNASSRTEPAYQANGYPSSNYTQNPLNRSNTHQIVQYNPNTDLNTNNRGSENLYQADVTPAYANSFLLTNILSTDYVDVTGDGPSYDDLGSFTKFNYSKVNNFGWREPYGVPSWATLGSDVAQTGTRGSLPGTVINQANFDEGLVSDSLDDKAFYEYGIRENYYPQSIETKNYVAFFECSLRDDYTGVNDENGTPVSASAYKLDKIKLYAKSELIANGTNAVPIKTVFFKYDYSLCQKTFNSNATGTHGKLTLTKVYFTYGNSQKAALSPYQFYYGDNNHDNTTDPFGNPEYNNKAVDRWGTYKPNSTNSGILGDETPNIGLVGKLNNSEFPYSEQDDTLSNQYASAWNLTRIITPSSSVIDVTYEADDYSAVQNWQPGQMLMINNSVNDITSYDDVSSYGANNNLFDANYLIVDLSKLNKGIPASMPLATANNFAKTNLFKLGSDLYYKCFMKLAGPANSFGLKSTYYDYVPGYATVENAGFYAASVANNSYTKNGVAYYKYAYVKVKKEKAYGSKLVNPISLASWEFMRSFLPKVAYPGSEPANMGDNSHKPAKQLVNALVGLGVALADFATGISGNANYRFYIRNFCKQMDYSKSFVRAYVPYKTKKGGGYRIKQLLTKDVWNNMTTNTATGNSEKGSVYGQSFNYTTLDVDKKTVISSGVAYYEPLLGGDEISLRRPIKFEIDKKMAPNDHLFQEEPYGEMLFPTGMVGYSKVTVTPIADPDPSLATLYKIGKSVFEFYTAKDYPIIEGKTGLNKQLYQNDLIAHFTVVTKAYKILHATQGHVLKFNDMHGKLKSINTYGQDDLDAPISGASYTYKDAAGLYGSRQLVTAAKTISEYNVIATEQIARDIDVTIDNRSNINESTTAGSDFVTEISLCSPVVNVSTNVIYGYNKTGLNTSVTTKIVQQYGILDKSEVFDNKSRTLTENLLWDRNTGNVILSKNTNNLDQPVYSFNYPAYWMYSKMGNEFKRENLILNIPVYNSASSTIWNRVTGTLQKASFNNPEILAIGDEVVVYEAGGPIVNGKRYWVSYDYSNYLGTDPTDHNYCLLDAQGVILNTSTFSSLSTSNTHYIKIIKPAERNQLNESAGSVSALIIPAVSGAIFNVGQKVISANVQTWCSGWNAYVKEGTIAQQNNCLYPGYDVVPATSTTRFNPYTAGALGNWRPYMSYAYNANRYYNTTQPNIKDDGYYSSTYVPFWNISNGNVFWFSSNANGWVSTGNNSVFSPFGYLMESMDAIGLYHANRYGFNHTLPILHADNARLRQVGFESFEDYLQYYPAINSCNVTGVDQLDFFNQVGLSAGTKPLITTLAAHTGRTSLSFAGTQNVTLQHYINKTPLAFPGDKLDVITRTSIVNFCGDDPALNKLNITPGKYLASFWIKGNTAALDFSPNFTFAVEIQNGSSAAFNAAASIQKTIVINGWQKFDYYFTVPTGSYTANSVIRFKFNAISSFYLDDFRVQPFNSSMSCTVYDPYQMRVWAQLDDNNYATIMEYDNEGMLVRKKKETFKGLYTVQETRQSNVKRN